MDRLKRWDIENVVGVVKWGLLIIERGEAHTLEVATISLLSPHHDPHGSPLGDKHRLDDKRSLVNKSDGSRDVVKNLNIANLWQNEYV